MNVDELLIIYLKNGKIKEEQIEEIIKGAEEQNIPIDEYIINKGYIEEKDFLKIFAEEFGFGFYESLGKFKVPPEFCQKIPINFVRENKLVAIEKRNGIYKIATSKPFNLYQLDDISSMLDAEVEVVLAPEKEIKDLIEIYYNEYVEDIPEEEISKRIDEEMAKEEDEIIDILDTSHKPYIVQLVNNIIKKAIKQKASDIHFQPYEDKLQIRYRIDGILYDVQQISKQYQAEIISRIKVMGKMDIAERRLPQDGRKTIKMGGKSEIDIRISSVPTSHGERIVMRLLDKSTKLYKLEEIGLDETNLKIVEKFIHCTHGIILVTGPTGSGKSTTLYAALSKIDSSKKNIMTIEDPIEYNLRGISQIQVSEKKGLTFAKGLRTLLRQDPDIIMVGEIRDEETARIAIQAALTGHLVLSTLHTNDSASAITRLLDIGVEPYLVSSSLIGVIAQRLVRKICNKCKIKYTPKEDELKSIGLTKANLYETDGVLWKGTGCEECMRTGYKGRSGIYEILKISPLIREQIVKRVSASNIKQEALKRGLRTLRMDGAKKVLQGITTIEEVLRVTQMDVF